MAAKGGRAAFLACPGPGTSLTPTGHNPPPLQPRPARSDQRGFDFPIATLLRDAKLLLGALRGLAGAEDPIGQPAGPGTDQKKLAERKRKKEITAARNAAANTLYRQCLSLQNAARLAYPSTQTDKPGVIEARGRFLLDAFPPRPNTASAAHGPTPPTPAAPGS